MPGRTPSLAYDNFLKPLSRAISCITQDTLVTSEPDRQANRALFLSQRPCKLRANPALYLDIRIVYRIVEEKDKENGPWRASTRAYYYQISDKDQKEILSYHWHPFTSPTYPHLHLAGGSGVAQFLRKAHLPTGRISLEEVLRLLISQLGAQPLKKSWENMLKSSQSRFEQFRSWP